MAFFNFKSRNSVQDPAANLKFSSPSLINPLYKPKTLSEIKAEIEHTGVNPWAHIPMREPIPNTPGLDPMDMPPVDLGGDVFESMRRADSLASRLEKAHNEYESTKKTADDMVDPGQSQASTDE